MFQVSKMSTDSMTKIRHVIQFILQSLLFVVVRVGTVSSNASSVAIQCLHKNIIDFEFHLERY